MTALTLNRGQSVPATAATVQPATDDLSLEVPAKVALSRLELQEFPRIPSVRRRPLAGAVWLLQAAAGLFWLIVLLALSAAIPVVNLFALGYLMESQARVARTGKFRNAFYLLPAAGRLGGIVLGVSCWLLPIHFLAEAVRDSWLISPGGSATWLWTGILIAASAMIAAHLLLAIGCGGAWWRFLRPIANVRQMRLLWQRGGYWYDAHVAIREFVAALRLPHLLWLGLIGYAATYLWLAVPTYLFTMLDDVTNRFQVIVCIVGGMLITVVLMWLPMMLVHVASSGRWQAMFQPATVLKLALGTPLRWALATAVLLACSVLLLLYTALVKNQIPPHAARWDLMVVFLVTIVPARWLVSRMYYSAAQRTAPVGSWPLRLWQGLVSAALAFGVGWYVYFLYLAQTGGELGQRGVWQYHALVLPLPW